MVNYLEAASISVSMSLDAASVNATNGLKEEGIKVSKLVLISFIFGLFQFAMPFIGYGIGNTFAKYIEKAIPWIAFSLLVLLSIKAFVEWIKDFKDRKEKKEIEEKSKIKFKEIIVQAIATSIDALCIGFVYVSSPIIDALIIFLMIGLITWFISFFTGFLAKYLSKILKNWSGLISAIIFLAVGIKILLESLL
ncbi:MAG: manganese efflux pump MntP family protein [Bacilli bacterium]